jgi:hypothetical protein
MKTIRDTAIALGTVLIVGLIALTAYAQDPPGCTTVATQWVTSDLTPQQTSAFVSIPIEGLGVKWATWKDGDQTLSINIMSGDWEGVMCMSGATAMATLTVTCRIPGITVIASKKPSKGVELLVCESRPAAPEPNPPPAPAPETPPAKNRQPANKRVVPPPLPPNAAGKGKMRT